MVFGDDLAAAPAQHKHIVCCVARTDNIQRKAVFVVLSTGVSCSVMVLLVGMLMTGLERGAPAGDGTVAFFTPVTEKQTT